MAAFDLKVQCPEGTFPCQTCPDICIEQWRNCNGVADCPDRSDESSCRKYLAKLTTATTKYMNSFYSSLSRFSMST